jgi:hypothetical protein
VIRAGSSKRALVALAARGPQMTELAMLRRAGEIAGD